jgi:hypothetical protein
MAMWQKKGHSGSHTAKAVFQATVRKAEKQADCKQ